MNQESVDFPKIPKYSIDSLLKTKTKIINTLGPIIGNSYTGEDFYAFIDKINACLTNVDISVLTRSLQHLAGQVITYDIAEELSWRISGNLWRLRLGMVVPPYTTQPEAEWCPMQITDVVRRRARYKLGKTQKKTIKDIADCTIQVLGGYPAGKIIKKRFSKEYLTHAYTKREFGYDRYDRAKYNRHAAPKKAYLLQDIRELTNNRFFGLIDPLLCNEQPNFKFIKNTVTFKKWNRELADKRRRESFVCPMNYNVDQRPCYLCEVGYERCSAGCHRRNFTLGKCVECVSPVAYIDGVLSTSVCVDCLPKEIVA